MAGKSDTSSTDDLSWLEDAAIYWEDVPETMTEAIPALIEELREARTALKAVLNEVGDPDNWDSPSSTLERIGNAVNSERYPVWARYSED